MRTCTKCGAKNDDDAEFCSECGTKIASDNPSKVEDASEQEQSANGLVATAKAWFVRLDPTSRKIMIGALIAIGALVVILVVVLLSANGSGTPTNSSGDTTYSSGSTSDSENSVTVPDVVNKTQEQAKGALADEGLNVAVQQEYNAIVAAGSVVSQDPASGESTSKGSTITLVVSQGPEQLRLELDGDDNAIYTDDGVSVSGGGMTDNRGNTYEKGLLFDTQNTDAEGGAAFALNKKYTKFTATIALPDGEKDSDGISRILIYYDTNPKPVFQSRSITKGFMPQSVSLDVTGVQDIKICIRTESYSLTDPIPPCSLIVGNPVFTN